MYFYKLLIQKSNYVENDIMWVGSTLHSYVQFSKVVCDITLQVPTVA